MTSSHAIKRTVWIVAIHHKHDTNLYACATEEEAKQVVADFCEHWWAHEVDKPMPEDRDELIEAYFGDEWNIYESYQIESREVEFAE